MGQIVILDDYEACGDCGYDHEYEPEEAAQWHLAHPCSYCRYNEETQQHEPSCPVLPALQRYSDCDSTRCRAGWATVLAGEAVKKLE